MDNTRAVPSLAHLNRLVGLSRDSLNRTHAYALQVGVPAPVLKAIGRTQRSARDIKELLAVVTDMQGKSRA